ncbi:MAG: HlyD family efflux transporter periplasmic adaptor subunit [Verrucomicrobiota bacterium]
MSFLPRLSVVTFLVSFCLALPVSAETTEENSTPSRKSPEATDKDGADKPGSKDSERPSRKMEKKADAREQAAEKGEAKDKKASGKEERKDIHVVESESLKIETKLSGIVESVRQTSVALDLKRWTDLPVLRAVAHGTEVKAGDTLIELDATKLREKIQDLREAMPTKLLDLETAELELDKLEKSTPINLEKARKAKMKAEEDLAYFEDVSRPMREEDARNDVKSISNYLTYAEEELNQLKKMYEADDLTEETEEIILLRAQNSVDEYRWMLEQTEERTKRNLTTLIPREHEQLKTNLELQQISWRTGEKTMRDALEKQRLDFEAKQRSVEDSERELLEYEEDLAAMKVVAPHDGIVYLGMNQRGKWTTASTVERKLIPGGKLTMREIVMTVADPGRLLLRVATPEDKLGDLEAGQDAEIALKWNPDKTLSGKVQSVSHVPFSDGTFDTVISVGKRDEEIAVFPGMKADATVAVYENEEALMVPETAIREKGKRSLVTLANGDEREVETGRAEGDRIEILAGLEDGDRVNTDLGAGEMVEKSDDADAREEDGEKGKETEKEDDGEEEDA